MFSKKLFFLFFIFCLPSISYANLFSDISCFKDMKRYYPDLLRGDLKWEKQKRFFRCLHDTLELVVKGTIPLTHDPSRDYFTKQDIFRMFYLHVFDGDEDNIDQEKSDLSHRLTNGLFFIKKALIGGSIDQLKDKEISDFYKLVYDYQEIYFILRKQIPVLQKAFTEGPGAITPQQRTKTLDQIRKSFIFLEQAYSREKIVYRIDDLYNYDEYLKESLFVEESKLELAKQSFLFLHNLLEGLFSPKKAIQEKDWQVVLDSLYEAISLFLYYKTYFIEGNSSQNIIYRIVDSMGIFISSLQLAESQVTKTKTGFPLNNLDEMLSVMASFSNLNDDPSSSKESPFVKLNQAHTIPLFTRTLNCFSLENSPEKNCKSEWRDDSSPVVTVSFADTKFELFPDKIQKSQISNQPVFIEMEKLQFLRQWIADYKQNFLDIHYGNMYSVAVNHQFDHWMNSFFNWEGINSRIRFGASSYRLRRPNNRDKALQLLYYRALLPLLFSPYLPEGFFSPEEQKPSISFQTWKRMMEDILPAFAALYSGGAFNPSWRESLFDLFSFADSFLYSSNRDELLNAEEFIDLTVHFLEAIKNSYLAYNRISNLCENKLTSSCATEEIISSREILWVYPSFQRHLFDFQIDNYKERIEAVLGGPEKPIQSLSFVPLFILISTMELNYKFINEDQSFFLESEELLSFAKKFEPLLMNRIPCLFNQSQARSYLIYSFQTGDMPCLTGDGFTLIQFTHWHLNPQSRETFNLSPNEFHFRIFDFYNFYQNF